MADVSAPAVVAALGKLALNFRLAALLVSVAYLATAERDATLAVVMVLTAFVSLAALLWWQRLAPWLTRHPAALFADVVATVAILFATGVDGPFVYYAVATAVLAGALHGWAGGGLLALGLVAGYGLVLEVSAPLADVERSFQILVANPALFLLAGASGAAVRDLLLRNAHTREELERALSAAASAEERARLAREMHDSIGKSLHGVALAATALPGWVDRDPERAAAEARRIAQASETAAAEARELIGDLRSAALDEPLHDAVRAQAEAHATATGATLDTRCEPVEEVSPGARYELFAILKEALRNVERHADASHVTVRLGHTGDLVRLEVEDDGNGFGGPVDLEALAADDHYGLVGMAERARRAGGRLIAGSGDRGARIVAEVPTVSAAGSVAVGSSAEEPAS